MRDRSCGPEFNPGSTAARLVLVPVETERSADTKDAEDATHPPAADDAHHDVGGGARGSGEQAQVEKENSDLYQHRAGVPAKLDPY